MESSSIALINGTIITMDPFFPKCEAVLVENGVITETGRSLDIERIAAARGVAAVDLRGKTAVPGFIDCHVHVMGTGLSSVSVDLLNCADIAEALGLIKKAYEDGGSGWIYCTRVDESHLKERRPPTMAELDSVSPDRGVCIIDKGLHYTVVNSVAYRDVGFEGAEPGLLKDAEGRLTGRLSEKASAMARAYFYDNMSEQQRYEMLSFTANEAVRQGITTLHGMEGGEMFCDEDIPVFLKYKDTFPLDMLLCWDTENVENVLKYNLPVIGTDLLLDGAVGSRTAAFSEEYADAPGVYGNINYSRELVVNLITDAHKNGLQAGFHAIGDRAITFVLDCLEESLELYPCTNHRFRIEHFGFPKDEDIERAARLGVVISSQATFTRFRGGPGSIYNVRLGDKREQKGYPLKKFIEAGIPVGGGSDSSVTPMNPILGLHSALHQAYPENNVDIHAAMKMYTIDGAYCAFEEKIKGSITKGKYGDITVLSDNPYTVDPEEIENISVLMTIKNGKLVYQKA